MKKFVLLMRNTVKCSFQSIKKIEVTSESFCSTSYISKQNDLLTYKSYG